MLRRAQRGEARPEDATLVYLRLLRILSRRGIKKLAAQTPREFAAAVPEPAGIALFLAATAIFWLCRRHFGRS